MIPRSLPTLPRLTKNADEPGCCDAVCCVPGRSRCIGRINNCATRPGSLVSPRLLLRHSPSSRYLAPAVTGPVETTIPPSPKYPRTKFFCERGVRKKWGHILRACEAGPPPRGGGVPRRSRPTSASAPAPATHPPSHADPGRESASGRPGSQFAAFLTGGHAPGLKEERVEQTTTHQASLQVVIATGLHASRAATSRHTVDR